MWLQEAYTVFPDRDTEEFDTLTNYVGTIDYVVAREDCAFEERRGLALA